MPQYQQEIDDLLMATVKANASDLHLNAGYYPILRIEGNLAPLANWPVLDAQHSADLAFALLGEKKEKFLAERELDFSYEFRDVARFRVNTYFQRGMVSAALRFIPAKVRTINELNLPAVLHSITDLKQGFVLVTGPSGHGKSTTLAALVDEINHKRGEHIITLEDPIEYLIAGDKSLVNQREMGQDSKSFYRALRSVLREDPNVIMLGEMRDPETMSAALTAAETGHLVLASLHTNSASQTIDRIIDSFTANQQNQVRTQLASTIAAVVSQRLMTKVSGGLTPAVEFMLATPAVKNLIREQKTHQIDLVIETSLEQGMISLDRSLMELVHGGVVSAIEAANYSLNPADFRLSVGAGR